MFGKPITPFDILGFNVRLDPSWIFLALLVTWSLATGYFPAYYLGLDDATYWWMGVTGALGLFASIIFHELAHSFVARRRGIPIKSITLFIFGGVAQMDKEPPSPKAEFLMAIAGPLSSFALSAACYLAFETCYRMNLPLPVLGMFGYLAFVNSLLGGFNLIPAFPLDGGRVLRAGLWHWKKDLRGATRRACLAGSIFGFLLMTAGIFYVITGNFMSGVWWFVLGLFLRKAAGTSYYQVVARTALAGSTIRRFMTSNPATVSSNLSLHEVIEEHFYRSLHDMYPVMENSRLIGCIDTKRIAGIPRDQWKQLTVRDVLVPCSEDNTVDINTEAPAALSLMNRTGNSRLMVMDGDRLAGIVTLKDLMKLPALTLNLERVQ
jgi:Zn-dependent protease/predicted transcriptional regulator